MKKIKFEYVRLFVYFVTIIIVVFVGQGDVNIPCGIKEKIGILCPACGLTRATQSIVTLNFHNAYEYNAFYTCVLVPLVLVLICNDIFVIIKRYITKKKNISLVEIIVGESTNE